MEKRTAPTEYDALKQKYDRLLEDYEQLEQNYNLLRKSVFGQKSEKKEYLIPEGGEQVSLFNEAETERDTRTAEREEAVAVTAHERKKKRTRQEIAADLIPEEIVHPAETGVCPRCGSETEVIGKEFVRDEIVYKPAELILRKHYVEVRKCVSCGKDEARDSEYDDIEKAVFVKGKAPVPLLPRSMASPGFLAQIGVEKYGGGKPLYRQEKDYERLGLSISRATMANWIIAAAEGILKPIWEAQKRELLRHKVIHADETVVQVLKEDGKTAVSESRMWVYCAGEIGCADNILFEYQPNRKGDSAAGFLSGFGGYLVTDGYTGYNKVSGVTRCACLAHIRRKFAEALPEKQEAADSEAARGVNYCGRLFALEREYDGTDDKGRRTGPPLSPEEKKKQREAQSKPVLDAFYAWVEALDAPGRSKLSQAKSYALGQKKAMYAFLEDPAVPISNNRAENAIRPFVVGRKQWLFSDSVKGAKASAVWYSILITATGNGLNPYKYFSYVFEHAHEGRPAEDFLSWNPALKESCT